MRDYTRIYIDGALVKPLDGRIIDVINPATECPAGQITLCTVADVDRAVEAARRAFISFSRSSRQERLDLLSSILGVYAKRQDDLADVLTEELGAPKKFAKEVQVGLGLWHLQTAIGILKDYKFDDYSVELANQSGRYQSLPGVCDRLYRGAQTFGSGSIHRPCARRDLS